MGWNKIVEVKLTIIWCFTWRKGKEPSIGEEGCGNGKSFEIYQICIQENVELPNERENSPDRKRQKARLWSIKLVCPRRRMANINLYQFQMDQPTRMCNGCFSVRPTITCSPPNQNNRALSSIRFEIIVMIMRILHGHMA